ncbi:hypothetical protein [Novosphingobium sp.]|uniref:hypothetical protein n=1 Tax=Novosphingobium sp. TaxID=1874826 RepID=UPI002FE3CBE2
MQNFDTPEYTANLTLARSGSHRTIVQAVNSNGRRAYLLANDRREGDFVFTEHKALRGYSETSPMWRQLAMKRAPTIDALVASIAPEIAILLGYHQALAA